MDESTQQRLIDAAFALFDERGFEQTTVDDIAERAQVGRTTFFRNFRSKEDVIFPDHDRLLGAIQERLSTSTPHTAVVAVSEAARIVLLHYLAEGTRARRRYALTSTVPALRDRETASIKQYQRLFRDFIHQWMRGEKDSALRAELMANAVVTAHNHVLRRWLRGESKTPEREFDAAMAEVIDLFTDRPRRTGSEQDEPAVLVLRTRKDLQKLLPRIERLLT
jgi:AcrR family transcriptional regulator